MMKLGPFEQNEIYCGDNVELCRQLPDECIDLTVTSPPYDNLRTYNGYTWDFEPLAPQLYRITKQGGVVVWVVGDATIDGSETGTSFRQALYFMECGFNLHDTMIYRTPGAGAKGSCLAYWQEFEYMFVLSKGKPSAINRIKDKKNIKFGSTYIRTVGGRSSVKYGKRGNTRFSIDEFGYRGNIWTYHAGNNGDDKTIHTAPFPEKLARDHIISWSNPGDIVLDPFMGSGTTAKAAMQNWRHYLGFEISQEYVDLARKRVAQSNPPLLVAA